MTDFVGGLFGQGSGASIGTMQLSPQAFITPSYRLGHDPFAGVTRLDRGFGATYSEGPIGLTPPQLEFSRRFPRALGDIDTLRTAIRPGFSQVREAGLGAFAASREREAGNLRESLARRNVLGSDFASDAFSRQAREFAQGEAEFLANVGLQEIGATQQVLDFERAYISEQLNRELAELGIATGVGVSLATANLNTMAQTAIAGAQLQSQEWQARLNAQAQVLGVAAGVGLGGGFGGGRTPFMGASGTGVYSGPTQFANPSLWANPDTGYFGSGYYGMF